MSGQHGGRRPGSGRPPLTPGGTEKGVFTLFPSHHEKIEAWRQRHDCEGASEALRQMIDLADKIDAATEPPQGSLL
jgi:hypothetical protein